jgi:hypothetical protein
MSTVSRRRLKSILGVGALLGIVLSSTPPSAADGPEPDFGVQPLCKTECPSPDFCIVDCGNGHRYCYQNNVYSGPC